jgi:small-conductance mechanosensitive channel
MSQALADFFSRLLSILNYPLFKLSDANVTLATIFKFALLVALVLVTERILRRHLVRRLLQHTRFAPSLQFAITRLAGYAFIALGCYVALQLVGINLTSLAVLAGAIGVGLGFGLQNIVHNFVSGLIILAERPISIGDRIEVGDVTGQVKEIRLRSTTVVTNDNITIIVPNSHFISDSVTNWSYGDPRVRIRLPLGVAYGTDVRLLERVLLEVAAAHAKVLRDPPPSLFFKGFGESALDFDLAVWTEEMTYNPRRLRSDLYFAIEEKLREHKIEIPFPQRDLHLRSGAFVLKQDGEANVRHSA